MEKLVNELVQIGMKMHNLTGELFNRKEKTLILN